MRLDRCRGPESSAQLSTSFTFDAEASEVYLQ